MNIVYTVTADFIDKIKPSLASLLEHDPKARVFLITEVDDVDLPVEVINISGQTWFGKRGVNYGNMFTYINLLKVCYPEILPVNKVIHLDADTIVCGSLEPMWKTNVTGKWFAAVPEYKGKYKPFGETYYNMGVALINLAQMRKDGIQDSMVEYLNKVKQPWADQDAWNKYALEQDKAVALPVEYNECFATGYTEEPVIVHYCGIGNWWTNKVMNRREYLERYMAAAPL